MEKALGEALSKLHQATTLQGSTKISWRSLLHHLGALFKIGDKVKKGQVLCIIKAMKLMNEIEVSPNLHNCFSLTFKYSVNKLCLNFLR
ncbi:Biotin carboxyl carrier protein of acetyl-CoA carboxylase [Nymphaea thermarum]|nr:Biotin carboxyl carrier protein of acetyl-CoA carboxylase [Nymphaea thermarum]